MEPTNAYPRPSALPSVPEELSLVKGKYRLLRLLGDGGMGQVYEALHEGLGVKVALKFLHPRLSRWPVLVQRFLDEARLAAPIRSPHVVQVLDVDQSEEGLAFIVLELLSGPTLREVLTERRLDEAEARAFVAQLCDGLEAVHQAGIVHRDLKPENVMVTREPSGEPILKLLDFGIARPGGAGEGRSSLSGAVLGTPGYMAPEQVTAAGAVDARADLFSLGVLLFEMLTGRLLGEAATVAELAPGIAPDLVEVIARATAPCPGDRFATAGELRDAIAPPAPLGLPMGLRSAAPSSAPFPGFTTPVGPVSRTSVEVPWFCVEPTPLPSASSGSLPAIVAPEAPPQNRRRFGPAVVLALAIGMVLGGGAAGLFPRGSGLGGRAPNEVFAAMLAAPNTQVEPDPAPPRGPTLEAPAEAMATAHEESAPGPARAPIPLAHAGVPQKPGPVRAPTPVRAPPPRETTEPPARLPAPPPATEIAPLPDPWPGARRRPPTARLEPREPRASAPPEVVIFIPVGRTRSAPWPGRTIQVIR
jgi:serine/threonine protein kinase